MATPRAGGLDQLNCQAILYMLQVTDMIEVWTMRELLAEIMRQRVDMNPYETGEFRGNFRSGATGTFIEVFAEKSSGITFFTYFELGENELLGLSGQVDVRSANSKLFDTYPLRLIVDSVCMAAEAGELNTQVFGAMEGKITKESITAVPRDGMPS
jgi:hypothetical protein